MKQLQEKINQFTKDRNERQALNQRFRSEEDFERAIKRNMIIWKANEYADSLRECGMEEEDIKDVLNKADIVDGYVIEYSL